MRLTAPRIEPLTIDRCNDEQRAILEPFAQQGRLYNIYSTVGHTPAALQGFLAWGSYVLRRTQLDPRERELVILRIGFLCKSGYEWAQHARLGKQHGVTDQELAQLKIGPSDPAWTARERVLLHAADELHRDRFVSQDTWQRLGEFLDMRQQMDLVYVIGHYTQVCMILNTFGIQLDAELQLDEELRG
jgi:alkylhydroperoxidase family enzyme